MRGRILGIFVFCLPLAAQNYLLRPQTGSYITPEQRLAMYLNSTAGPYATGKSLFVAGFKQWTNSPPEWGQGMSGYSRRVAYRYARRGINNGIEHGVGALIGEDPRYFRSHSETFWGRAGYAVSSAFTAPNEHGGRRFAYARFAGAYGGAAIANSFYPPSMRGVDDTLIRGSLCIGGEVASNLFREFWPDLKRKLFKR